MIHNFLKKQKNKIKTTKPPPQPHPTPPPPPPAGSASGGPSTSLPSSSYLFDYWQQKSIGKTICHNVGRLNTSGAFQTLNLLQKKKTIYIQISLIYRKHKRSLLDSEVIKIFSVLNSFARVTFFFRKCYYYGCSIIRIPFTIVLIWG